MDFCKKLINSIIFLFFIVLCLFLIQTSSSAETFGTQTYSMYFGDRTNSFVIPGFIADKFAELTSSYNPNDYHIMIYMASRDQGPRWQFNIVKRSTNPGFNFFYDWNQGGFYSCSLSSYVDGLFGSYNGSTWSVSNSSEMTSRRLAFSTTVGEIHYSYSEVIPLWATDNSLILNSYQGYSDFVDFPNYENTFSAPVISFPNNNGTADYISGEFSDFMIVGNDANIVYFNFNDGSVDFYDTQKAIFLTLDDTSPYYLNNYTENHVWVVPKNILGGYYDGHIYNLWIEWRDDNNVLQQSQTYSWTTNFSEQAVLNDEDRYRQELQNTVNEIGNFLTDNTVSNSTKNSFVSSMPSSDNYTNPADNGINTIFNSLQYAFTNGNAETLRFYIPFTNGQYIEIPPNIVSSHLPSAIINLIQMFYWFLICRYIIKDISNTANKAKSGELLDDKDGNIKTDLL